ncbi:MAG: DUF1772 domain-containing protein [Armatimonas sp.]
MDSIYHWLKLVTALGSGVIAGVFFAFSTFVMRALARMPAAQGMAAMQHINITVINPLFMLVFMGCALTSIGLIVIAMMRWSQQGALYVVLGAGLYLVGTILVTMLGNVPLNDALAKADPASADGIALWERYQATWMLWNHVRTIASLGAATLLTLALYARK